MTDPARPGKQAPGPARYAGLGIQLAASILVFVFGGRWLDQRLGTRVLFTLVGAGIGFGGFMWSLIRQLNKDNQAATQGGKAAGRQGGKGDQNT